MIVDHGLAVGRHYFRLVGRHADAQNQRGLSFRHLALEAPLVVNAEGSGPASEGISCLHGSVKHYAALSHGCDSAKRAASNDQNSSENTVKSGQTYVSIIHGWSKLINKFNMRIKAHLDGRD